MEPVKKHSPIDDIYVEENRYIKKFGHPRQCSNHSGELLDDVISLASIKHNHGISLYGPKSNRKNITRAPKRIGSR